MRQAAARNNGPLAIVEIGGANSCFFSEVSAALAPRSYDVVDTNEYGLSLLARRANGNASLRLHQQSVFEMALDGPADLVFSVGLVEHFDPPRTRAAVLAHFDILRSGGTAIITFPTPTSLYRATRTLIEKAGMWKFHDERPLHPAEVRAAMAERGEILREKMLWPLMLTQYLIVAIKH